METKTRQEHLENTFLLPGEAEVEGIKMRRIGSREQVIFGRLKIPVMSIQFLEALANGKIDDAATELFLKAAYVLATSKERALVLSQMPEAFDAAFMEWLDGVPAEKLPGITKFVAEEILRVAAAMFESIPESGNGDSSKNAPRPAN